MINFVKDLLTKKWKYQYGENRIEVINSLYGYELHVNGQLQDEASNMFTFSDIILRGKVNNGEEIKATIGQTFGVKCTLFVDNKLLNENTYYPIEQKTTNQSSVKEVTIIKEIVKIPCTYCNQLVDITANKCPNCGANKRSA